MNFPIPCTYYSPFPQYCVVNQPMMFYAYPPILQQPNFEFKPAETCATSEDSKELQLQYRTSATKVEEVATSELSKPVLSLTESDLERYICSINRKLWSEE